MAKERTRKYNQNLLAYLFLFPAFSLYFYFVFLPAFQTFYISLTSWDGIGLKKFIGLNNYIDILTNEPLFWLALRNSVVWAFASAIIPVSIGLILANFLVRSNLKFGKYFQMILFLPQVISSVIAAVVWKWIYDPIFGPFSYIMKSIGLEQFSHGWLGDPEKVMVALFIIYVWQSFGFSLVVFTAAIQGVDQQLYDAAKIDGCNVFKQFWHVTIPSIRSALTSIIILMTIWSFGVFDIVMATTKGGPGYSSYVISYYVYYQAFVINKVGYGAAASIILTIIVLIISKWFMHIREKE